LIGNIPRELGNAAELSTLQLSGNNLGGVLPAELAQLELVYLDVSSNQITNVELGNYSVAEFVLYNNMINQLANDLLTSLFPIPDSGNIEKLDLSNNMVSGEFSNNQIFSNYLTYLDVSKNQLIGSIDNYMSGFPNMKTLMLFENNLMGAIPQVFPAGLVSLNVSHGGLYGGFPQSLPVNLTLLDVSYNNLNGTIPNQVPLGLAQFYINNNMQLTGTLPQNLGQLTNLRYIDLSNTNLCGSFPSEWKVNKYFEYCNLDILHECGTEGIEDLCIFNRTCDPNMVCFVNQCDMKNSQCDSHRECIYREPWSFTCADCQYHPYIYQNDGDYLCAISWIIIAVPIAFVVLVVIVIIICCKCCKKSRDYSYIK